ncbi:isoaspartyl peptidase/L-asparaginase [Adhaeribacter sp. BT258]|uniref:Isoaspartyl peptidase/L-asparaginase n=1 Tax=Adhaeribacter terrigena TaxID=2793070 RepID=A0ABS1C1A6_9BACT|nr:isoaspartyl peptidase/L-asparaginase [Adhaeribacter terrigena]MBK0403109.1 isoaspartyl peptidase/L-asparaginase [Adhaeribacter terrigena]
MNTFALALHGGAGTITRQLMSVEDEKRYLHELENALQTGRALLAAGHSALDAVEATVMCLENCELFNAGKGSVFTKAGKHEMDASIMSGVDLKAGAVSGVRNVKNPIKLAHCVMKHSDHVLLSYPGAEDFARQLKLEFEPETYFFNQLRYDQWQQIRDTDTYQLDHSESPAPETNRQTPEHPDKKFGTVGAVALDLAGNLAAATSTGGMTNKNYNRIGDTPIIGAGTYANNATCAISCTGHGEFFMRAVVAHDISCLMEYRGLALQEACKLVVNDKLVKFGGEGGLIAIDRHGNIALPFNSEGMYRASCKNNEPAFVAIYKD